MKTWHVCGTFAPEMRNPIAFELILISYAAPQKYQVSIAVTRDLEHGYWLFSPI